MPVQVHLRPSTSQRLDGGDRKQVGTLLTSLECCPGVECGGGGGNNPAPLLEGGARSTRQCAAMPCMACWRTSPSRWGARAGHAIKQPEARAATAAVGRRRLRRDSRRPDRSCSAIGGASADGMAAAHLTRRRAALAWRRCGSTSPARNDAAPALRPQASLRCAPAARQHLLVARPIDQSGCLWQRGAMPARWPARVAGERPAFALPMPSMLSLRRAQHAAAGWHAYAAGVPRTGAGPGHALGRRCGLGPAPCRG